MNENGLSLSDIAAITKDGSMGEGMWIILLIILLFGGGNFFGRNGDYAQFATAASQNEILSGQKFDALSRQINQVGDGLCSSTYALNNAILGEGRSLQTQISNVACEGQRNTDALRYDISQMIAGVNANTTAQTQAIKDMIAQDKIEALQQKIASLELANATGSVVRYPTTTAYCSGANPFCGCGCGCPN